MAGDGLDLHLPVLHAAQREPALDARPQRGVHGQRGEGQAQQAARGERGEPRRNRTSQAVHPMRGHLLRASRSCAEQWRCHSTGHAKSFKTLDWGLRTPGLGVAVLGRGCPLRATVPALT